MAAGCGRAERAVALMNRAVEVARLGAAPAVRAAVPVEMMGEMVHLPPANFQHPPRRQL